MEPQYKIWTYTPYSCNFESILGLEVRGKQPPELPWTDSSLSRNNFRTEMKKPGRNIHLSRRDIQALLLPPPPPYCGPVYIGTSTVYKQQFGQCMFISCWGNPSCHHPSPPPPFVDQFLPGPALSTNDSLDKACPFPAGEILPVDLPPPPFSKWWTFSIASQPGAVNNPIQEYLEFSWGFSYLQYLSSCSFFN